MKNTGLSDNITKFLADNPNATSNQVSENLHANIDSVKMSLWKLAKSGKIIRERQAVVDYKAGPKSVYLYRMP
jgi:predicted transcriptional regulator